MIAEVIRMREEQNKKPSQKVIKMLRKRWVVPAIYLASAAIILTGALWYQFSNSSKPMNPPSTEVTTNNGPEALPVSKVDEKLAYPVSKDTTVEVKSHFYDDTASASQQQQSLIVKDSTYTLNTGVDLAKKDGKSFDVTAALSGTVTKAEKDSELGYVVTVDSGKGLVSYYESLQKISVKAGDKVKQGQVVGVSGTALIGKENGTHVHFELRKDGVAINPEKYINQEVSVILSSENNATDTNNGSSTSDKKPAKDNENDKGDSADYQG
jgi:stage II sporulation protein Q